MKHDKQLKHKFIVVVLLNVWFMILKDQFNLLKKTR